MIRTEIQPHEVFDREALQDALGLRPTTLAREVRKGRLKVYFRAKKHFFLGADILDWLRAGEVQKRPVETILAGRVAS
jgi:hypothetical protein